MVMNAMSVMKKTKQQLHESGFKLTPQREATLQVLLENEKEHLSAEEVFFLVKKESRNWVSYCLSDVRDFDRFESH